MRSLKLTLKIFRSSIERPELQWYPGYKTRLFMTNCLSFSCWILVYEILCAARGRFRPPTALHAGRKRAFTKRNCKYLGNKDHSNYVTKACCVWTLFMSHSLYFCHVLFIKSVGWETHKRLLQPNKRVDNILSSFIVINLIRT